MKHSRATRKRETARAAQARAKRESTDPKPQAPRRADAAADARTDLDAAAAQNAQPVPPAESAQAEQPAIADAPGLSEGANPQQADEATAAPAATQQGAVEAGNKRGKRRSKGAKAPKTDADGSAKPEMRNTAHKRRSDEPSARRRAEQEPKPPEPPEDSEMMRRASEAVSEARDRIRSGITTPVTDAGNAAQLPSAQPAQQAAAVGKRSRRDKWQRDDNAFNMASAKLHTRLKEAWRYTVSSMSARISLRYSRVITHVALALSALLLITLCCIGEHNARSIIRDIGSQLDAHYASDYAQQPVRLQPRTINEAYVTALDSAGNVLYSDIPFDAEYSAFRFTDRRMFYVCAALYDGGSGMYRLYLALQVDRWALGALIALLVLAVLTAALEMHLLLRSRRMNAHIIQPIIDISETARHLGADDLSERLNVEGTRYELRELAMVINDMLERIERSYNAQKQFVSDASHELRTPIAVVQGYADMLARWGKDDPAVRDEATEAIRREADNMKQLVEKLLFLARHDRGTLQQKLEAVDMGDIAREACSDAQLLYPDRTVRLGAVADVRVMGDPGSLKQAVRIFADNACKYTPPGGEITISCEQGGLGCLLSVADTGCGIPAEALDKIFDRFYRVDESRGEIPGHGLGLAIARMIAVDHGGRIHVRSKEGAGSVFTLELPGV